MVTLLLLQKLCRPICTEAPYPKVFGGYLGDSGFKDIDLDYTQTHIIAAGFTKDSAMLGYTPSS